MASLDRGGFLTEFGWSRHLFPILDGFFGLNLYIQVISATFEWEKFQMKNDLKNSSNPDFDQTQVLT
jgi:hypothetical protein